jgi:hypothetical protein
VGADIKCRPIEAIERMARPAVAAIRAFCKLAIMFVFMAIDAQSACQPDAEVGVLVA